MRVQLRHEPRFRVRQGELLQVVVQRADEVISTPASATLRDLSRGGAKLLLDTPLTFQEAVVLTLQTADQSFEMSISAEVCWTRAEAEGKWLLGFRFAPELPEDGLEKLFTSGLLERRLFPRHPRSVSLQAQWEMDPHVTCVTLSDLSEGGFCIQSPKPRKAGRRVLVAFEHAGKHVEVPAKTQWELKVDDGYLIGCEFINKNGFYLLRQLQPPAKNGIARANPAELKHFMRQAWQAVVGRLSKRPPAPQAEPEVEPEPSLTD